MKMTSFPRITPDEINRMMVAQADEIESALRTEFTALGDDALFAPGFDKTGHDKFFSSQVYIDAMKAFVGECETVFGVIRDESNSLYPIKGRDISRRPDDDTKSTKMGGIPCANREQAVAWARAFGDKRQ